MTGLERIKKHWDFGYWLCDGCSKESLRADMNWLIAEVERLTQTHPCGTIETYDNQISELQEKLAAERMRRERAEDKLWKIAALVDQAKEDFERESGE